MLRFSTLPFVLILELLFLSELFKKRLTALYADADALT
jgi:hypothetical protein